MFGINGCLGGEKSARLLIRKGNCLLAVSVFVSCGFSSSSDLYFSSSTRDIPSTAAGLFYWEPAGSS
jgi:hypothetical protein